MWVVHLLCLLYSADSHAVQLCNVLEFKWFIYGSLADMTLKWKEFIIYPLNNNNYVLFFLFFFTTLVPIIACYCCFAETQQQEMLADKVKPWVHKKCFRRSSCLRRWSQLCLMSVCALVACRDDAELRQILGPRGDFFWTSRVVLPPAQDCSGIKVSNNPLLECLLGHIVTAIPLTKLVMTS